LRNILLLLDHLDEKSNWMINRQQATLLAWNQAELFGIGGNDSAHEAQPSSCCARISVSDDSRKYCLKVKMQHASQEKMPCLIPQVVPFFVRIDP